ncbi:MAG: RNA 2',3'-cyclic phosphodiesterase [Limisphaerales bacterium]
MTQTPDRTSIRAFVAIAVPAHVLDRIKQVQQKFRSRLRDGSVRWLRPDQIHLTLRFLGNVPANQLGELKDSLERVCGPVRPFSLHAEGAGSFPDVNRPRILWVGLTGDVEAFRGLEARLAPAVAAFGDHAEDRDFSPHLTVGRVKTSDPGEVRRIGDLVAAAGTDQWGEWRVEEVKLMRSDLSAAGVAYRCLAAVPLAGGTLPRSS